MALAHFSCPHCEGLFQADTSMAGTEVTCPFCSGVVTLPEVELAVEDVVHPQSQEFSTEVYLGEVFSGEVEAQHDWSDAPGEFHDFAQRDDAGAGPLEDPQVEPRSANFADDLLPPSTEAMDAASSVPEADLAPPAAMQAEAPDEILLPPTVAAESERLEVKVQRADSSRSVESASAAAPESLAEVLAEQAIASAASEHLSGEQQERRRNLRSLIKFVVCFAVLILAARLLAYLNVQ